MPSQIGTAGSARGLTVVVFGHGDYAQQYVWPGVRQARELGMVPSDTREIAVDWREPSERASGRRFIEIDVTQPAQFMALRRVLDEWTSERVVYYLALAPTLYRAVAQGIVGAELNRGDFTVVVEKPVGEDYFSSAVLQQTLSSLLGAGNVVYNDHYLAKPAVMRISEQGMRALRGGVPKLSSIRSITISTLEDRGVGERAGYFDPTGLARDVFCHLMKVMVELARGAGDGPRVTEEQRLAVLEAVQVLASVRGQYGPGNGMPGYLQEPGVPDGSRAETYFAMRLVVDNPRWRHVQWVIEAGKRASERRGMVTVKYRDPDRRPSVIDLHASTEGEPKPHATIIAAAVAGRDELFVSGEQLLAEWQILEPLLTQWSVSRTVPDIYPAGTDRPDTARLVIEG